MRTLAIETGIEPEYEQALIQSAKKYGWDVHVVRHVPFEHVFEDASPELLNNPEVWFHGDILSCKSAQLLTRWQVHAPWEELRCSSYYEKLKGRLVQEDHFPCTLEDLGKVPEAIYASGLSVDDTLFFRPDGCDKVFTGTCISWEDFPQRFKELCSYDPDPLTEIIVARPQNLISEARFLIEDGKLVTGSWYRVGTQKMKLRAPVFLMEVAQELLEFCLERNFNPAPSWILDIAETHDEGWRILEVGASSCCGLYASDTDAFIKALGEAC